MKILYLKQVLILMFLISSTVIHAKSQLLFGNKSQIGGSKSLKKVLKEFEKHYKINFVYDESLVEGKFVNRSQILFSKDFEENLRGILNSVNLSFKKIDAKLIVIQAKADGTEIVVPNDKIIVGNVQEIIVVGQVTDEKGEAIPGVSVVIKGKKSGTSTDGGGNFKINIEHNTDILVFTAVGFLPNSVQVADQKTLHIVLKEDIKNLTDLVVVGYTTEKKSDLTGSLVTLNSKDLDKMQVSGIDQAMQGKAAGVNIYQSTGAPGDGMTINIRGVGSINDNSPLYIIDGVPTKDGINIISPSDIKTMTILKDASSAAIYGARAANGVVVVTTKKGVKGEPRVNFNTYFGTQQHGKLIDMVSSDQYVKLYNEAVANDNAQTTNSALFRSPIPSNIQMANTNWQKAIMQTGTTQNSQLSISGGGENSRYLISGSYLDQKGIILNSGFKRYTLKANIEADITSKFRIGTNLNVAYSSKDIVGSSGDGYGGNGGGIVRYALFSTNANPIYNQDGTFADMPAYPQYFGNGYNPVGLALKTQNNLKQYRFFGNFYAEYNLTKNLKFKSDAGIDANITNQRIYSENWGTNLRINNPSQLNNTIGISQTVNWNNTLTYSNVFAEKHNFMILAGTEAIKNDSRYYSSSDKSFLDQIPNLEFLGLGSSLQKSVSETNSRWALLSFFSRATYAYQDKYLITANVRRDGSSRFSEANRWGNFYSGSIGWNIDREAFMQKYSRTISLLKVRASIGQLGNQDIGNYPWASIISNGYNYPFGLPQTQSQGYTVSSNGNSNIKWESSTQADIGIDAGFWQNKLLFTADIYQKTTSNMLLPIPVPPSGGTASAPYVNAGSVRNQGLEMQLIYRNKLGKLKYEVSANCSFIKNKVLSLNGTSIAGGRIDNNTYATLTTVGHSIGEFYMYQMEGIFQNTAQIFTHAYQGNNIQPGDVKYKDVSGPDGKPDGKIDQYDRTFVGSPIPKMTYGFTANIQYLNFDLNVFFQGVYGNKIYYQVATDIEGFYRAFNITERVYNDHWTGEGTSNDSPRLSWAGASNNKLPSSRFLEDGSYLRLKNIQIGYTLNENLVRRLKMRNIRMYVTGQNLLTFTKYPGMDPEMGTSDNVKSEQFKGPVAVGIDWGTYPSAKTYTMGFNINF